MHSIQRLVLPKKLYEDSQKILKQLNKARLFAKKAMPDQNNIYPDTSELEKVTDKVISSYRTFVNDCRSYLGPDELKPLSIKSVVLLKATEESKMENK